MRANQEDHQVVILSNTKKKTNIVKKKKRKRKKERKKTKQKTRGCDPNKNLVLRKMDLNETEINDLPDGQFNIIVIKIPIEIRRHLGALSNNKITPKAQKYGKCSSK